MNLVKRNDVGDNWRWRRINSKCRKSKAIRVNTIFEKFNFAFSLFLKYILFTEKYTLLVIDKITFLI